MAYNKSKHVENAQKHLHQAKVTQAIAEYQVILKHEPKDQVTLMTIGDLYVRQGETFQALEYFERLAKIFLNDGFVAKAIAIYKKIAKLAPEETRFVERLAELYVQQGVLSEARPIYLQLAELHERTGRQPQAAQLLRKLLDAEPDNLRVQTRLAELSATIGQPNEAVAGYFAAAEQLYRRGDHVQAVKYADLALGIRANDVPTVTLKARALAAAGHRSDAQALLLSLPDIENGGDAADLLLDFYLEAGQTDPACGFVSRIFGHDRRHFAPANRVAAMLLETEDPSQALPLLDLVRETMTDAGEHEMLSQSLIRATEKLPGRIEPREWLVDLYGRASDSFRLPDALANLAEAYEAAGRPDRAQQAYEQLLDRNPENEGVRRKYKRLQGITGGRIAVEEVPAAPRETPPSGSPANGEPALDEETQLFVSQSLTDVDLFSSYGLTQKAIDLLEVVLLRAPRHTPTLERLLDLSLGAGDEHRIAELASRLEHIHSQRGDAAPADRFAELRRRFERAAGRAATEAAGASSVAPPEFSIPEVESPAPASDLAVVPTVAPSVAPLIAPGNGSFEQHGRAEPLTLERANSASEPDIHEIDLSEEWAALAGQLDITDLSQPAVIPPAETASADATPEFEVTAIPLDDVPAPEVLSDALSDVPEPIAAEPAAPAEPVEVGIFELPEVSAASASESAHDLDPVMEPGIEAITGPAIESAVESTVEPASGPAVQPDASSLTADDFLNSLSGELDTVIPAAAADFNSTRASASGEAPQAHAPDTEAPDAGEEHALDQPISAEHAGPLNEVFDEFRAGLGDTLEDEDPETHYNLGVAYREMGLAEESISEFQKVAQMVERDATRNGAKNGKRRVFRYAMQCCTLLGLAFIEKGEPAIAAMWYGRALETHGLDQDSILALRYDLGVAQELAGDTVAARRSFSQVYGTNIDYRDVAERLAALGKGR